MREQTTRSIAVVPPASDEGAIFGTEWYVLVPLVFVLGAAMLPGLWLLASLIGWLVGGGR